VRDSRHCVWHMRSGACGRRVGCTCNHCCPQTACLQRSEPSSRLSAQQGALTSKVPTAFGTLLLVLLLYVLLQAHCWGCVYLHSHGCGRGFLLRLGLLSQSHCR
jgi:hypothetical protein